MRIKLCFDIRFPDAFSRTFIVKQYGLVLNWYFLDNLFNYFRPYNFVSIEKSTMWLLLVKAEGVFLCLFLSIPPYDPVFENLVILVPNAFVPPQTEKIVISLLLPKVVRAHIELCQQQLVRGLGNNLFAYYIVPVTYY